MPRYCFIIARSRLILGAIALTVAASSSGKAIGKGPRDYLKRPAAWFAGDEGRQLAANVIDHQSELGGWPKNLDTTLPRDPNEARPAATFDNGATTGELAFLARAYVATRDQRQLASFNRGLDHILVAQYANGGWPQHYPPGRGYARYITFNDDAMVRLMHLLADVATRPEYEFVDSRRRSAARTAFDRGIECILKCQIVVDGQLTAWCAQHDEVTFEPRPARTFELASLSGSESVGIVRLLMSLDQQSRERHGDQVVPAVQAAVRWFEQVKISGLRQVIEDDPRSPTGKDKRIVPDTAAPPLWARFYEIGTNRPLFADRDGEARYDLAEIGYERRNGYGWYTERPREMLQMDYPRWQELFGRR